MSRTKKAIFYLIGFAFIYLFAEGAGYVAYGIINGEGFSAAKLIAEREELNNRRRKEIELPEKGDRNRDSKRKEEIIHPYMGYVLDYHDLTCSGHGFCDDTMRGYENAPVTPKGEKDFMVAIFGGSVAAQTSLISSDGYFQERLKTLPGLEDKNIVLQTIAIGGFKQPQQLMALNWFYSIGADFDLIINLDGFNEVALAPTENVPLGTNPYFPRIWHNRAKVTNDTVLLATYGRIEYYKDERARKARKLNRSAFRFSPIRNLIWQSRDRRTVERISGLELSVQSYKVKDHHVRPLVVTGPDHPVPDLPTLYRDLAENWYRSSLQMNAVATAYGAHYFHFLQPNQYVEGSKPMGPEELEIAYLEMHPYRQGVVEGYPMLIERGAELAANGVAFHDLTRRVDNNSEVLYSDKCCHFNEKGYNMIIDYMVARMGERIRAQ